MNNLKLRSSVSVVKISDEILEFFLTNTRRQVRIKVKDDTIMNVVCSLDGNRSFAEIAEEYNIQEGDYAQLQAVFDFLKRKSILCDAGETENLEEYQKYRRIIHFLEDYAESAESLSKMWNNIRESKVVIIGLGAVGTWVAINLVQSGVKNIVLIDNDVVDISNLHRQFGFKESEIGYKKTDVMEKRLKELNGNVSVIKINEFLDGSLLERVLYGKYDLIINCADKPNVDTTSLWVGEYCMKHNIPHIVGGGYNLHLSLIGQTVIPNKSACVKCFETKLDKINKIDSSKVKKMETKNRKLGSFGPMCSIIASMVGMEAIKVLSKELKPANINRRGEFNIYNMEITYKIIERNPICEWCGEDKHEDN